MKPAQIKTTPNAVIATDASGNVVALVPADSRRYHVVGLPTPTLEEASRIRKDASTVLLEVTSDTTDPDPAFVIATSATGIEIGKNETVYDFALGHAPVALETGYGANLPAAPDGTIDHLVDTGTILREIERVAIKDPVRVATTAPADVSGYTYDPLAEGGTTPLVWTGVTPAPTIDGVTLSDGDRLLIKDATDARGNGVFTYDATAQGFRRAADADNDRAADEVHGGLLVVVTEGTTNAGTAFLLSSPTGPVVLGTDTITFAQHAESDPSVEAGTGISVTGIADVSVDIASLPLRSPITGNEYVLLREISTGQLQRVTVDDWLTKHYANGIFYVHGDLIFAGAPGPNGLHLESNAAGNTGIRLDTGEIWIAGSKVASIDTTSTPYVLELTAEINEIRGLAAFSSPPWQFMTVHLGTGSTGIDATGLQRFSNGASWATIVAGGNGVFAESKAGFAFPAGTSAQRPASPARHGNIRFNTDTGFLEYDDFNGQWQSFGVYSWRSPIVQSWYGGPVTFDLASAPSTDLQPDPSLWRVYGRTTESLPSTEFRVDRDAFFSVVTQIGSEDALTSVRVAEGPAAYSFVTMPNSGVSFDPAGNWVALERGDGVATTVRAVVYGDRTEFSHTLRVPDFNENAGHGLQVGPDVGIAARLPSVLSLARSDFGNYLVTVDNTEQAFIVEPNTYAFGLPAGPTASRPSGAGLLDGVCRWNTDTGRMEVWTGSAWFERAPLGWGYTEATYNGGAQTFTNFFSDGPPASQNMVLLYVNTTALRNAEFTISGTDLTVIPALTVGDVVWAHYVTQ